MHTLIPPDAMVVEAIEEIDKLLTDHAIAKVKTRRTRTLVLRVKQVFLLRILLAEIKRLREMNKPKLDTLWQIYDVADTDEEVRQAFIARYDREPTEVWRDGGCVHAGPITKE